MEYEAGAGPMHALRSHVEAIRTESGRIGTKALRATALGARERLSSRPEPVPARIAALDTQIVAKLNALGDRLEPTTDSRPAGDSSCDVLWALAAASFELADETTLFDEIDTYTELGYLFLDSALDCEGAGSA